MDNLLRNRLFYNMDNCYSEHFSPTLISAGKHCVRITVAVNIHMCILLIFNAWSEHMYIFKPGARLVS